MPTWVSENAVIERIMPLIFQTGWSILAELLQNAQRAGAKNVRLDVSDSAGTLEVIDDGTGLDPISGIKDLLTVGVSQYENPEVDEQYPAGMGFYALLSRSETVEIKSRFGSVLIDSHRWFNEQKYRNLIPRMIDDEDTIPSGTNMLATGIRGVFEHRDEHKKLALFDMNIIVNGKKVERFDPAKYYRYPIHIHGVDVWFYSEGRLLGAIGSGYAPTIVNWYGHAIQCNDPSKPGEDAYINVIRGRPFDPKLPDRKEVIKNDTWETFYEDMCAGICRHILALPLTDLLKNPRLVKYAQRVCPDTFQEASRVGVFFATTSAKRDVNAKRAGVTVVMQESVVRVTLLDGEVTVVSNKPGPSYSTTGYNNDHLLGMWAKAGHEILEGVQVPAFIRVLKPKEVRLQLFGDVAEPLAGVYHARRGEMVFTYEDGEERRYPMEGQVFVDGDYIEPSQGNIVMVGDDPAELLLKNADWLFEWHEDMGPWDDQMGEHQKIIQQMVDDLSGTTPMVQALQEIGINMAEAASIHFARDKDGKIIRAQIVNIDGEAGGWIDVR